MKKIIILAIILLSFSLFGCNPKVLTVEQSQSNYSSYRDSLQEIAQQYNMELVQIYNEHYENHDWYVNFTITETPNAYISIEISNTAYIDKTNTGVESFSIDYYINNTDSQDDYNIPLFVDLVNCVSGRIITVDYCEEFLNAPESKYSAERYGFQKMNGEIIAKEECLNFFEDWSIGYRLSKDNEQRLYFGGLTKQSSE